MLRDISKIERTLEEQIENTQILRSSPFAKAVERDLREWETRLLLTGEVLREVAPRPRWDTGKSLQPWLWYCKCCCA